MFRVLLKKTLIESSLLWCFTAVTVFAFCWTRVWIVTRFELHRFESFLDQLKQFEQFMPVPLEQVLTYKGSLALTFDEPVLILCIMVWAISRGSDVVSGELGRGTLEMLLAQPISRGKLLGAHALICISGLALLCTAAWLGLYAGIATNSVRETVSETTSWRIPLLNWEIPLSRPSDQTVSIPLSDRVDPALFLSPCLNLFALGLFIMALSTLCSCWDRYRWRTIGIVIGVYVVELLVFLLAKATPQTSFCYALTFFTLYQPDGIVNILAVDGSAAWHLWHPPSRFWPTPLGPLGVSLLLLFMASVCYAAAFIVFQRRDLPAPA